MNMIKKNGSTDSRARTGEAYEKEGVELYVPDWLRTRKGLSSRHPQGRIIEETDKAILFSTTDFVRAGSDRNEIRKEIWLPKSQINVLEGFK